MCKLGDSALIIVRHFPDIFFRCVLLANVYFEALTVDIINQCKISFNLPASLWVLGRPADRHVFEELGKAASAQPVPSGDGGPRAAEMCGWPHCREFTPSAPFPHSTVA